jgi:hypothetical protein
MDLWPTRRGAVHYVTLSLGLLLALLGACLGAWLIHTGLDIRSQVLRRAAELAIPPTLASASGRERVAGWALRVSGRCLDAERTDASVFATLLLLASPMVLSVALTTPGRAAFPIHSRLRSRPSSRKVAWMDLVLLVVAILVLCALSLVPSRLMALPVPQARVPLGAALARARLACHLPLAVDLFGTFACGLMVWRLGVRLRRGLQEERRKRREEEDALALDQF